MMDREEAILYLDRMKMVSSENWKEIWKEVAEERNQVIDMAIEALSAEPTDLISRADAVSEIHKYFVEEIDKTPTEIDEDGDEVYTDMPTVNSLLACNKELSKRIKALPSADRPSGEWVDTRGDSWVCSNCGVECYVDEDYRPKDKRAMLMHYCHYCGAKMGSD